MRGKVVESVLFRKQKPHFKGIIDRFPHQGVCFRIRTCNLEEMSLPPNRAECSAPRTNSTTSKGSRQLAYLRCSVISGRNL
jgi:hypothetical protein